MGRDEYRRTYGTLSRTGNGQKSAMKQVAKDRGVGKRDIYQALL